MLIADQQSRPNLCSPPVWHAWGCCTTFQLNIRKKRRSIFCSFPLISFWEAEKIVIVILFTNRMHSIIHLLCDLGYFMEHNPQSCFGNHLSFTGLAFVNFINLGVRSLYGLYGSRQFLVLLFNAFFTNGEWFGQNVFALKSTHLKMALYEYVRFLH